MIEIITAGGHCRVSGMAEGDNIKIDGVVYVVTDDERGCVTPLYREVPATAESVRAFVQGLTSRSL